MKDTPPPHNNIGHKWLWLVFALSFVLLAAIPLDWLVSIGSTLSPVDSVQPKSLLLFRAAKIVFPVVGVLIVFWLWLPAGLRQPVACGIHKLVTRRQAVYGVLALCGIIRVCTITAFPTDLYADSEWYFSKGVYIAEGLGYIQDRATQVKTAAWPVGYPAFLGLLFKVFGPSQLVAKLANVPLGIALTYFTYAIGTRMFGPKPALLAAGLVSALPGLLIYTTIINSDLLFLAVLLLGFCLVMTDGIKTWFAIIKGSELGIVAGLAGLVRPTGIILGLFWIYARWLCERGRRANDHIVAFTSAMVISIVIVVLPWTIRNYRAFGRMILVSTNSGLNFWMGNNPGATGGFYFPRDPDLNPLLNLIGDEIALDETAYRLGMSFVREHPGQAIALLPKKLFYLLTANDSGIYWAQRSASSAIQWGTGITPWWVTNLSYALVAAFALMGVCLLLLNRKRGNLPFVGVAFSFYWTIMHLPFFGDNRFMLPLLPFMCLHAGFAVSSLFGEAAKPCQEPE